MNALLYARVSTEKQSDKDLSIPAQLQGMRDYARQRDWAVVEEFIEPGASAKTSDRPSLQRLLSRVRESGGNIDVVLVHKIDRLARNVFDHATIKAFLKEHGVRLASVVENTDDTVSGQLVENIMASIAQFYSANLGEEVRKGMRQKVLKGGWPHRPPRGYRAASDAEGHAVVVPDPVEAQAIKQAFETYAAGRSSFRDVAKLLFDLGVATNKSRPLSPEGARRILSNEFYMGRVTWRDLAVAGTHEPLVSATVFERAAQKMKARSESPGSRGTANGFPLRGIAICASCRGNMTAGWHKSANGRRFGYYRCNRRAYDKASCPNTRYCPASIVHTQIRQLCDTLRLSPDRLVALRADVETVVRSRATSDAIAQEEIGPQLSQIRRQELQLTKRFIAGEIQPSVYTVAARELADRRATKQAVVEKQPQPVDEIVSQIDRLLAEAESVGRLQGALAEERQRDLLRIVFQHVVLDFSGMLGFALRPPFDEILPAGR
jgi:DNA invertase Pin-like site-specific DNA recombinase